MSKKKTAITKPTVKKAAKKSTGKSAPPAATKKTAQSPAKPTVKKRTLNAPNAGPPAKGAPAAQQDIKRRLGNFTTAGEAPRKGGRNGIVGQTTKQFNTDNKQ